MSHFEARARVAIADAEQKQRKRNRVRQTLVLAAPFCALIMFVSVTQNQIDDDPVGVVTAAEQWIANRPASYVMTYVRLEGTDEIGPATVAVGDQSILAYDTDDPRLEDSVILTVDQMLLLIEANAVDPEVLVLRVDYDAGSGRPTEAVFDHSGGPPSPWGFRVLSFEPLNP